MLNGFMLRTQPADSSVHTIQWNLIIVIGTHHIQQRTQIKNKKIETGNWLPISPIFADITLG